jgi:poly(A) polymerase
MRPTDSKFNAAIDVVRTLKGAGFDAFLVGGCVRDMILQRRIDEYDIATNALPDQVKGLFKNTKGVGKKFGVVIVNYNGFGFDVATFRSESGYFDGRHPGVVTFSDARADALRRDFTINGLFYDPVEDKIYDWVNGLKDIESRVIRAIGCADQRFKEDHLRMLRAVRFATILNFEIEAETFESIKRNAHEINKISKERIREELLKIFLPGHAHRGLELLQKSGLLKEILPDVDQLQNCRQDAFYHPEGSVFDHVKKMLSMLPEDASVILIWSVLLHDIAKPRTASLDKKSGAIHFYGHEEEGEKMARRILKHLRFPNKQVDEICFCVRHHMQLKDAQNMRKSKLRQILMRPTFPIEFELHRLDCLGSNGDLHIYEFLKTALKELEMQPELKPRLVSGNDLIKLGLQPGPIFREILMKIREKQLQGELKTKAQALDWVKNNFPSAT